MKICIYARFTRLGTEFRFVSAILSFYQRYPSRADVDVQPVRPGGSIIQPYVHTPIQMAGEVLNHQ
jgi:hypothetical protein